MEELQLSRMDLNDPTAQLHWALDQARRGFCNFDTQRITSLQALSAPRWFWSLKDLSLSMTEAGSLVLTTRTGLQFLVVALRYGTRTEKYVLIVPIDFNKTVDCMKFLRSNCPEVRECTVFSEASSKLCLSEYLNGCGMELKGKGTQFDIGRLAQEFENNPCFFRIRLTATNSSIEADCLQWRLLFIKLHEVHESYHGVAFQEVRGPIDKIYDKLLLPARKYGSKQLYDLSNSEMGQITFIAKEFRGDADNFLDYLAQFVKGFRYYSMIRTDSVLRNMSIAVSFEETLKEVRPELLDYLKGRNWNVESVVLNFSRMFLPRGDLYTYVGRKPTPVELMDANNEALFALWPRNLECLSRDESSADCPWCEDGVSAEHLETKVMGNIECCQCGSMYLYKQIRQKRYGEPVRIRYRSELKTIGGK